MARKKRKHSYEGLLVLLLVAILLTVLALLALELGWLEKSDFPLPDTVQKEESSSPPAAPLAEDAPTLRVCYLDVGQGDSALIIAPEATLLIDAGTAAGGSAVVDLLEKEGIAHLDYIINTHPHADHVGGLSRVTESLAGGVDRVLITEYAPELEPNIQSWPRFLEAAEEAGASVDPIIPDTVYDLGGGASLTVLGPTKVYDDMNAASVICRVDFGEASFLFTGDATVDSFHDLIKMGTDIEADLLKVAHHGSDTSTNAVVLQRIDPKAAVISVGAENDYGHPHSKVTKLLERRQIPTLRTDLQGDIWAETDGSVIELTALRGLDEPLLLDAS